MDIKFEGNDSFKLGDGSSFSAKPSSTALGQEKGTLLGGADPLLKETIDTVKTTYKIGMAAATAVNLALSVGGAYLVNQKKVGNASTSDNLNDNLKFMAAGALPCTIASLIMNKVLRGLHTTAKTMVETNMLIGGMVKCDKKGVTIQANTNTAGLTGAQVKIATINNASMTGAAVEEASMVIAKNGDSITLKRGTKQPLGMCTLDMTKDTVKLSSSLTPCTSTMTLDRKSLNVDIEQSLSTLSMSKTSNKLALGPTSSIEQSKSNIKLKLSTNEVTVASQNINMKMGANKLTLHSAGMELKGAKVTISGQMVNIG